LYNYIKNELASKYDTAGEEEDNAAGQIGQTLK
jgi:hypothetical protein